MSYVGRALQFLGYFYLIRVPLLTWALLIALWAGSFHGSGAEPILRGIFDIASPESSVPAALAQFAMLTLAALLAGTSMGVSARLVVCNAHLRFRAAPAELSPGLELTFRLVPLVAFAAIVGTAQVRSSAPWAGKVPGVILGAVLWYLVTIGARDFFGSLHSPFILKLRAGGWFPISEPGYFDPATGTFQQRHLFATYQFLLALAAYLTYFILSFLDLRFLGGRLLASTLSLVLLLLTLFCWGLSGITFFLDRYRVPLLIPIAALFAFNGLFRQGDYFYEGLPLPPNAAALNAADLINAHASQPIVLVATTGGGIQAAAWTALVLTGLNDQIAVSCSGAPARFSSFVRLISSVSGGSVGAMYFAAAYENGAVKPEASQDIVSNAEASGLDQITWGLAYPDLVFGFFPWLKGLGLSGDIFADRGRMLETSWRPRLPPAQNDATLARWRSDAAAGLRPAVIFNSTLVETGDRYLLSTTGFADENDTKPKASFRIGVSYLPNGTGPAAESDIKAGEQYQGRWEFFKLYPGSDLGVRTAARLSATFPYVTPAARILRTDRDSASRDARFYRPEPHAVDGGYYDNYGMVSLLDWLDNGLQSTPVRPKILIVEIRASPSTQERRPRSSSYGATFQLTNPLQTLFNVRGTGQLSHNALDEKLMNRIYPNVSEATFEFSDTDATGCPRNEPLNWHLTPGDIAALKDAWANSDSIKTNIALVRSFLDGAACQ